MAVGLLLAGLWATLLIQSSASIPTENHNREISYGLTLPNIMAPVIRKDLHKEAASGDESYTGHNIKLPGLWELFSCQK